MSKVVAYDNGGKLAVIYPVDESADIREMMKSHHSNIELWTIVDKSAIPEDRYFRDAWKLDADSVAIDMPKARAIHMDNIRAARREPLENLDLAYQRADEEDNSAMKQKIVANKKLLRDLPTTVDLNSISSPKELKKIWPEILTNYLPQ